MKNRVITFCVILSTMFCCISNDTYASDSTFKVDYKLIFEEENRPEVEILVRNRINDDASFSFSIPANALGAVGDIRKVFTDFAVTDETGQTLRWKWSSNRSISINAPKDKDVHIKYKVNADMLQRQDNSHEGQKFALFRNNAVFFIAGDIFMLPNESPSWINVELSVPEGIRMFSTMSEEGGQFIAGTDLWGNILLDFQKQYFIGGRTVVSASHTTQWGDNYTFLWFDYDPRLSEWFPDFGQTDSEIAEKYMELTEEIAGIYREFMGPLPSRKVLFANAFTQPQFPSVMSNTDWFHYMQIWPQSSAADQIAHHVFHQYSFFATQSKLAFKDCFLGEGLSTYLECTLAGKVPEFGHDLTGKIYEFLILDQRGREFGIAGNNLHKTYNQSAMKVYLMDRMIKKNSSGNKDIRSFINKLWSMVKDETQPRNISNEQIVSAFASVAGNAQKDLVSKLGNMQSFKAQDFEALLPAFGTYAEFMASEYFWKSKLLFAAYLEIIAVKGNEWPHYATAGHNIENYRNNSLEPFKRYLEGLKKQEFTKEDILNALTAVTGKKHTDFFKFWASIGYELNPDELLPLGDWMMQNNRAANNKIPESVLKAQQREERAKLKQAASDTEETTASEKKETVPKTNLNVLFIAAGIIFICALLSVMVLSIRKKSIKK